MESKDLALVLIVCIPIVAIAFSAAAASIWGKRQFEEDETEDDQ